MSCLDRFKTISANKYSCDGTMSEFFGNDWKKFAPHPIFNEWLPLVGTIVGLASAIISLMVGILAFDERRNRAEKS